MDKDTRRERDLGVCNTAKGLVSFRYAEFVLLYAATENEIDVTEIAEAAWKMELNCGMSSCRQKGNILIGMFHTKCSTKIKMIL